MGYTNSIKQKPESTVYKAYLFETKNDVNPNFCNFIEKQNLNCEKEQMRNSPKAISYVLFKTTVNIENYLDEIENTKHKTSLSRFRLSNYNLLIEKGRHMRPRLDRNERKCFNCRDKIEDAHHFITECPIYNHEREILFESCNRECQNFDVLT